MNERTLETGAWVVVAILAAFILINAVCMLLLPQAWYSLPRWLRLQGLHSRELLEDRLSGLQMRALGAVILAILGAVAFALTRTAGFP